MYLYEKLEDIIASAAEFHSRLGKFYDELTDEVKQERVRMLLEFLSRQEKRLEEGLKRYLEEEQKKHESTRLQYVPWVEQLFANDLDSSPDMEIDDLVEIVKEMDDRLLTFYQDIAGKATIPHGVRNIFKQLAEQEEEEKAILVRTADQMKET